MSPEIGTAAAWSKERFAGLGASLSVRTRAYSANEPSQMPNTSSPGSKPVTSVPTASTVPARLRPGLEYFGRRSPKPARRIGYGRPAITCQVPRSTLAACTRTRTSSSPIVGLSISSSRRTSSGAGPYSSWTIAVIVCPFAVTEVSSIGWAGREPGLADSSDDHVVAVEPPSLTPPGCSRG